MGFNVTALAQKARTATLIADSDLNLGNYDLIATDVKGDTAEFSEFVGGVGNFESGLISGGLDVGGTVAGSTGTFSGAVTTSYIGVTAKIGTSATDITYATCAEQTVTMSKSNTDYVLTVNNYSVSSLPKKIVEGVYITKLSNSVTPNLSTRTLTINNNRSNNCTVTVTRKDTSESTSYSMGSYSTQSVSLVVGKTYAIHTNLGGSTLTATIPADTTYYLSVPTS